MVTINKSLNIACVRAQKKNQKKSVKALKFLCYIICLENTLLNINQNSAGTIRRSLGDFNLIKPSIYKSLNFSVRYKLIKKIAFLGDSQRDFASGLLMSTRRMTRVNALSAIAHAYAEKYGNEITETAVDIKLSDMSSIFNFHAIKLDMLTNDDWLLQ